jgi:glycosyltransferase involved in cell wall biosynthesis
MTEDNPDKIKKAEIVVCIPSFNEADTIRNVVEQIDEGLSVYFPEKSKVIINSDNNSPDGTREVFLKTKTLSPKIYISTPEGVKGKGNNLKNLFEKVKDLDAKFIATVDGDLKSITPDWIRCLISPLFDGYDFITPVYFRHKYDGFITNHLCYPVVYGVLGYNIRQPIGGDMSFSRKLIDYLMEKEWSDEVNNYGIDIFITLNAIKFEARIGQSNLGAKVHKPSTFKLDDMFKQVATTLFAFLSENKELWQKNLELKEPSLVTEVKKRKEIQRLPVDYKEIEERAFFEFSKNNGNFKEYFEEDTWRELQNMYFKSKSLDISIEFWAKIIYELFARYLVTQEKNLIIKALKSLYYGRVASYMKENSVKTHEESENLIKEKVKTFFENRNYLLKLIS